MGLIETEHLVDPLKQVVPKVFMTSKVRFAPINHFGPLNSGKFPGEF